MQDQEQLLAAKPGEVKVGLLVAGYEWLVLTGLKSSVCCI
jgi:hypothetical protein